MSSSNRSPPSHWEKGSGSRGNSRHLEVNGQRVKYIGPGSADKDAACVRANTYVPLSQAIYYFEVQIISKGRDGYIGVGFCTADVNMDRLPGWEPQSYGYHGDDGNAFRSDGKGRRYGPTFGTGDVVGALLNRAEQTIAYFKNGIDLGTAFLGVAEEKLYPCVGMQTHEEEVLANFGEAPFKADVESMKVEAARRLEAQIQETVLPARGKVGSLLAELIFDYMVHNCYFESAAVVARDLLDGAVEVSPQDRDEVRLRAGAAEALVAGRIDDAMSSAEHVAPGVLQAHPGILFRLQCQKFMELVRQRDDEGAVKFGSTVLKKSAATGEDQELLQDALSLLGYNDPASSPCGSLLGTKVREDLAKVLTAAILKHTGKREQSALERIGCQLEASLGTLLSLGDPRIALIENVGPGKGLKH
ncbi:SPRY-domain-containing protein [Coccomyxa subellipsoidea C-169]|uniref:SPRY-domain-containing protein n=1 Tax=Coccomyxa subellipsoidea (strain C-169) TaxID=574566 RepID=I0Z3D4_COCSC|nr:SPRY-domain-containing protein [Coccomyxa subellipsoidea C-169]EIE25153.1 SPRY-domain-containing protein [Coccomyxa subellipsoidea C-169]|eukprot:XP_005649697.1 SPRY-domain-containing protein [Coccomyxa subellipsoidea C-169]